MKLSWHERFVFLLAVSLLPSAAWAGAAGHGYDPLAVADRHGSEPLDIVVKDEGRGREIPIRVYLPAQRTPQPVVLFSHGLGGSREGSAYLGKHWAAAKAWLDGEGPRSLLEKNDGWQRK